MNPLAEPRNPWRQTNDGGLSCPLCKPLQRRRSRHADERGLLAHLEQQHGDQITKHREEDPSFDLQVWRDSLIKRDIPQQPIHRIPSPPQATPTTATITPSPSSSQEFGMGELSLNTDSKKRPTARKGEVLSRPDQDSHRSGKKRAKMMASEHQGSQLPPVKARRGSPRTGRGRDRPAPGANQGQGQLPRSSVPSMAKASSFNTKKPPLGESQQHTKKLESGPSLPGVTNPNLGLEVPKNPCYPDICLQLDSREISQEQLAAEVKSIYSGLSMVEAKCIHVDSAQAAAFRSSEKGGNSLAEDHWQALIALHRTLLHEHHDFFLASQHPSASPALKRLAAKYSMPARMWKHGIHSFLELLRCRLPSSREYMRTFIYFAYHMMALLYETVPSFEDTWIECLGDLGRYRMAIEDDDARERDTWAGISQYWYRMAADRSPGVGRLYHHLAILARSEPFQQVYYYSRSFTCVHLFPSARESVLAVFDPVINRSNTSAPIPRVDTSYTKLHAIIFLKQQLEDFRAVMNNFLELLDNHIMRSGIKWRELGAWLAISNIGALFEHGSNNSVLRQLFKESIVRPNRESDASKSDNIEKSFSSRHSPTPSSSTETMIPELDALSKRAFYCSLDLTMLTFKIVLQRQYDKNILAHIHILLAFLVTLADIHSLNASTQNQYVKDILNRVPWSELCSYTTTLANSEDFGSRFKTTSFLEPERGDVGPLPEDYLLRGQVWTQTYFPSDWFQDDEIDAEERSIEHASTVRRRAERVLSLMFRLASHNKWVRYDDTPINSRFAVTQTIPAINPPQVSTTAGRGLTVITTEDVDMDTLSDIETLDVTGPDSPLSEDDSKEMRILKDEIRHKTRRRFQPPQLQGLQVPSSKDTTSGRATEIIREGFTKMVCDVDLLLNQQDVFKLIVDRGYPIIIPNNAITELFNLAKVESPKFESPEAHAAQIAIDSIKAAIDERKDIQILTPNGENITSPTLLTGKVPASDPNDGQDPEEALIGVSRRATDLSSQGEDDGNNNSEARPAILLTEDKSIRVKASYQGVASLATSMLRKFLTGSLSRKRSPSVASSTSCHSPRLSPI